MGNYSFQDYVKDALRTESVVNIVVDPYSTEVRTAPSRLLHAAIGLTTESGELIDALKKHIFYGKPLDTVNLKEELGDLLWYVAIAMDALKLDPSDVMLTNVNKLRTRYPEKFNSEQAVNRNLEAERETLEQ